PAIVLIREVLCLRARLHHGQGALSQGQHWRTPAKAWFMSILQERDSLAEAFFGVDRAELDFVFDHLNQRYFQPIARVAETLPLLFQVIARESNSIAQKIESSPQIPSYEKLLKERCGYGRLGARIMALKFVT